jgi:hypothetical protein
MMKLKNLKKRLTLTNPNKLNNPYNKAPNPNAQKTHKAPKIYFQMMTTTIMSYPPKNNAKHNNRHKKQKVHLRNLRKEKNEKKKSNYHSTRFSSRQFKVKVTLLTVKVLIASMKRLISRKVKFKKILVNQMKMMNCL